MAGAIEFSLLLLLGVISATHLENRGDVEQPSEVLSRRKRFIVFPDGSSFQLVFCTQNHGYLQIGDIVWFGNTAALAWELPSDPKLFYLFKDHEKLHEAERRNGISKSIYYLDEEGKVLTRIPYHKRPIVNPAFAKRSVDETKYNGISFKTRIKLLHKAQKNNNFLKLLDEDSAEFHREGRKSFYAKLEIFLEGLSWRGQGCLLRMLCETGRSGTEQGTFLQEIMRATLTLPQNHKLDPEHHDEYDKAHFTVEECEKIYPHCDELYKQH